jgi:hypothetical protein
VKLPVDWPASPPRLEDVRNSNESLSMICRSFLRSKSTWKAGQRFKTAAEASARPGSFRRVALACTLAFLAMTMHCRDASAQGFDGFGGARTTVVLERKMPAVIQLPGTAFDVRMAGGGPADADVGRELSNLLLIELQKDDDRLHSDPSSPDEIISCSIVAYQTPPPTQYVRQETQFPQGRAVQVGVPYFKVTGLLTITYQVSDAHKRTLDAGTITANYSREFKAGTNEASDESLSSKVTNPLKRIVGKKTDETVGPPTKLELQQLLCNQIVSQLAPRLVNTDEKIEVMLARGKQLDEANKLALKDQWTRYLETLETMTPFSKREDDVYRLYNIGVANEALAYETHDSGAIQKFLDKAAIDYGKAIDGKPSEKYFIDPQTRIEVAVAHYRKLGQGTNARNAEVAPSSGPSGATVSSRGASTAPANVASADGGSSGSALTDDKVIKMAQAGVDEDSIISAIRDAVSVRFDLSPDGLINLANNGVKGKIVTAMRERSKAPPRRTGSATSGSK